VQHRATTWQDLAGKQTMIRIAQLARSLIHQVTNSYHPERHYMRGPGPKWRAKHQAA
jgi:hypothetical protein